MSSSSPARRPASAGSRPGRSRSAARRWWPSPGARPCCASSSTECRTDSPRSEYLAGDLGDRAFAERVIDDTVARHGRLDVLINNAAVSKHKQIYHMLGRRGGVRDAHQLPLLRLDHVRRHSAHAAPGRRHDRQRLVVRRQGGAAARADLRGVEGGDELVQRGAVERPRGIEHPRGHRQSRSDRHGDLGEGGRARRLPREEVPARARDRGDLRGDRVAPSRGHRAAAEPAAR